VIVVAGEGMPVKGDTTRYGDMHVTLRINFPGSFSAEQKAFIKGIYE
jgi:DnaJ-class molecular chaperone